MSTRRWTVDYPGGIDPEMVALTWAGRAFHKAGPKLERTTCGREIKVSVPLGAVMTRDYCRRCWGPGYFRREGE